jgi:GGDEF domain-containing protein
MLTSIIFTGSVRRKPNDTTLGGLSFIPGEYFAVLSQSVSNRNARNVAHELAHLLGETTERSGVPNRLNLLLHDGAVLSDPQIDVSNELTRDQVKILRSTLPKEFLR